MSQAPPPTVESVADFATPTRRLLWPLVMAGVLLALAAIVATLQSPYRDAYGYGERGWLDWLIRPLEINPELRLPRVDGNLNAIAFADDGTTGFAVGDGGVILATDDGGLHWQVKRENQPEVLTDVAISSPTGLAVAVGPDGTFLQASYVDSSWTRPSNAPRGSFRFVEASQDWGTFLLVAANGASFELSPGTTLTIPTFGNIAAVAISDSSASGWAGDSLGEIRTANSRELVWRTEVEVAAEQDANGAADAAANAAEAAKKMNFDRGDGNRNALQPAVFDPARPASFSLVGESTSAARKSEPPSNAAAQQQSPSADEASQQRVVGLNQYLDLDADPVGRTAAPITALAAVPGTDGIAGIRRLPFTSELFFGSRGYEAPAILTSLAMVDEQTGWAAGEGQIWGTRPGNSWDWERKPGVPATLYNAIAAASDGQHVWAAGADGTLIATDDGGKTWFHQLRRGDIPAPDGSYWRFPALWFYFAFIAYGGFLANALRPLPAEPQPGVSAMGSTDAAVTTLADDKLQFAPLARGISRYLRNRNTQPPLTLAISGEWGSGKSSLMRMICEDLRDHGNHPVWFNAWHHQDEEQLLAALLAAIRDKALPPWLSLDGLKFRIQLFLIRARRKLVATLALVGIASFILAVLTFTTTDVLTSWVEGMARLFSGKESARNAGLGTLLIQGLTGIAGLAGLITTVTGISRALRAFGANPAVLLTSTIDNFKLRDAAAQVHFRTRFQRQFDDVTEALPYPLVIVIDDLDRCRPETVLQVMESVNFLMTSGKCFVLFGMSTPRVQAALALSFKDIAQEFVEIDPDIATPATPDDRTQAERVNRLNYAGDYLQKLINLDIRVPSREDIAPHLLLTRSRQPEADEQFAAARRWFGLLWPLALVAAVAGAAWWEGSQLFAPDARDLPTEQAGLGALATQTTGPSAATGPRPRGPGPAAPETSSPAREPVEVIPGQNGGRDWPMIVLLGGLLAAVAALQYRRRKTDETVADTDAFSEALRVWTPIIARRTPSPRAIKRFGNRLRYLAMLQQAEDATPNGGGILPGWLARRFAANDTGEPPQAQSPKIDAVAEHRVVALGAIHTVLGDNHWRAWVPSGGSIEGMDLAAVEGAIVEYKKAGFHWPPSSEELDLFENSRKDVVLRGSLDGLAKRRIDALEAINNVLGDSHWREWKAWQVELPGIDIIAMKGAIQAYTKIGKHWPPSNAELDAFERSLKGIRLGGEVAVLDDAGEPPRPASSPAPQSQPQAKGPLRKKQM